MAYQVEILRPAFKELRRVDKSARARLITAIRSLGENPRPAGARKLSGRPAWRIRVGDYRIVYEIHDDRLVVLIIALGHRRDIYR